MNGWLLIGYNIFVDGYCDDGSWKYLIKYIFGYIYSEIMFKIINFV